MIIFIECGFRLGTAAQVNAKKAQTAQVRAIMGAGLGLLAFMLAFTFNIAQSHYEVRVQGLAEEVRIVRNAYMQADLLALPDQLRAKQLLKDYVVLRLELKTHVAQRNLELALESIKHSEQVQQSLWSLAVSDHTGTLERQVHPGQSSPLLASALALTDIHSARLHSTIMNRIPVMILITLYFTAALAMTIMGYQAGLTGRRSPLATFSLAIAFSSVMMLTTDLDRPIMSFFQINDQLMVGLLEQMESDAQPSYYPAD